mmetsp:Transcript_52526/g.151386  ORF Transcript_52526/g.151386 Transcript_52526/m.151386 type:complete len:366 (-) Transcript_52526:239-1336(-)|eukprot:CAMPEP_0176134402 /NCGR_PEP_ID=MMETSP0120_2-20121206/68158_1 /TAXON_ID=160619 /ORGANISM="Kryptoperidinium foliaceum, Strain CCMP 1326" /LENGTH=365 /DNA_ID=CAMNT_0017470049 /DNA_START=17 /DNA_END=1114 /DNA_ORIENTATION=+
MERPWQNLDVRYFYNGVPIPPPADDIAAQPMQIDSERRFDPTALASIVDAANGRCIRIFVAGAVTHVGKTTVCLGILAALRAAGVKPSELGYVKPATQCEAPDLLKKWCAAEGIDYVSGEDAPLVFYSGFTRSFLAGEQGTSDSWLARISAKVDELARGKRVLIIDGVGFPAVGSIVGVDNVDVAKAARAPVLLVCKSGVGSAIDSFNLNRCYFVSRGVPVIGAVFNLGALDGFYAWDKCSEMIEKYFSSDAGRRERYYGVVPIAQGLDGLRERISETAEEHVREMAAVNASHFAAYADIVGIVGDAATDPWCRMGAPPSKRSLAASPVAPRKAAAVGDTGPTFQPKSREQVVGSAKKQGARGGG